VSVRFTTFFLFASQSRVCELTHRNEGDGVFVVLFITFLLAAFFLSAKEEDKEEAQTSKSFRSKMAYILRILAVILDDDEEEDDDDDEETTTILFIFFAYFCDFFEKFVSKFRFSNFSFSTCRKTTSEFCFNRNPLIVCK
jgi:hypothetical protein